MKEIGGYLGLDDFSGKEYYPDLLALNTGRNALACLIRGKKIKKLYIPAYLCDSVFRVCEREFCKYEFYDIDRNFQPIFNNTLAVDEWIYIVNYFGQIYNEKELKERFGNIIFDNVQAFFQEPVSEIDTIYSCRKFFGVPDGAYLSSDIILDLPVDMSKERMAHILGRYEGNASDFYDSFEKNEELFYGLEPKLMSKLTHNLLRMIDYDAVKTKREKNFLFLHEQLKEKNRLDVNMPVGPYMYPLYVENGLHIRRKLIEKKIYIPILWPTAIEFGEVAKEYSENILPLPVDQRYEIDDMDKIVQMVLDVIKNLS